MKKRYGADKDNIIIISIKHSNNSYLNYFIIIIYYVTIYLSINRSDKHGLKRLLYTKYNIWRISLSI